MPQFNQEKMIQLVSELRKAFGRLQVLAEFTEKEFLQHADKIGNAKYQFIVAIECCIDMCNHVISRNGYRVPEDYADTFRVMAEVGALNRNFSEDLGNMARFHNRLVHLYWEVDDVKVYEILQSRLGDFKRFLDAMASFLGWQNMVR